mmetsp:Transcript_16692/g.42431  ORF Transcript_16692/g.42431 Transcript_16692/m.42431 type:complete len:203 (-) Transcript_16692:124-732(-)
MSSPRRVWASAGGLPTAGNTRRAARSMPMRRPETRKPAARCCSTNGKAVPRPPPPPRTPPGTPCERTPHRDSWRNTYHASQPATHRRTPSCSPGAPRLRWRPTGPPRTPPSSRAGAGPRAAGWPSGRWARARRPRGRRSHFRSGRPLALPPPGTGTPPVASLPARPSDLRRPPGKLTASPSTPLRPAPTRHPARPPWSTPSS